MYSVHSDHNNNFCKRIIFLQTIMECVEFYQYFECFQPLWETVWQGTVMGWRSQAARRPRMPSPDYFSVVPTLMDPTLTSKYLMDLSILLYSKIQNILYMYWSVLFWHYRYHVDICNIVNCYTMIAIKCTYYRQITCVVGIILCILVPKSNHII